MDTSLSTKQMRTLLFILLTISTFCAQAQTQPPKSAKAQKDSIRVLDSVKVHASTTGFGFTRLKDVDGAGIYAGKKSEVVILKDINANTATNNSRQIFSKVAGLNIYENDGGAGLQLAIGGRGPGPQPRRHFH